MFIRKQYKAVAEIFASHEVNPDHCSACEAKSMTLQSMALDFAAMFERDNPLFSADRFYEACRLKGKDRPNDRA